MNKTKMIQNAAIFFLGLTIGFLTFAQSRSFQLVKREVLRDQNQDLFREIQILKSVTDQLQLEIGASEKRLSEISSRVSALQTLEKERGRLEILTGTTPVSGPGIVIILPAALESVWFVDLQNELATAGAEAIAINKRRIGAETGGSGPGTAGYRFLPPDTLLLGSRLTRAPFTIEVIGDAKVLTTTLLQPGGIVAKMQKILGKREIVIRESESIVIAGDAQ